MLIICPECGHNVSDKAISCPNCGYPINIPIAQETENKPRKPVENTKNSPMGLAV